jgi:hypothetical protein
MTAYCAIEWYNFWQTNRTSYALGLCIFRGPPFSHTLNLFIFSEWNANVLLPLSNV